MKEKICEKIKDFTPDINITKDNLEIFETRGCSINSYLSNKEQVENISSISNNYSYGKLICAYIVLNEFTIVRIKKYLPNSVKEISTNTNINIPVYQKVENADSYYSDDKGFPFLINLPKLSQFENEEKMIDRRLLGWIVYREIVKFYQNFTEYKIATHDPLVELDERVYEYLKQIKEEESLNKKISTSMKASSNNINSDDDSVNDTGNGVTNILNNDDELDSHQGNASSNNDASLSDVQINDNIEIDPEDVTPMNDDEDTILENTNQVTQSKQSDAIVNDAVTTDVEMENREDDVENIYEINDGWKIMPKLFDVQLIYTDKINESFYSNNYNLYYNNYPRIALYNAKDNSSKESEPYTYSCRNNTENRSAKIKLNPKDLLIMVTWKPDILKFLFGEKKFDVFTPKPHKNESIKRAESKPISLEECIKEFIKDEILTDENKWFCPKCK